MTERDAFELRFGAAVRGYVGRVSSDLDPVELAHRIVEREPRRHGFATVHGWRGVAIPRAAWVLLLLAVLLTALVGGMLVVGSQQVRKLPALVPPVGQVFACPPGSTPDAPGPLDQARPAAPQTAAFDRRAGRLVVLADALTGVEVTGVETWTFDVCSNTWTQMQPDQQPPTPGYRLVYDIDSDVTILISYGKVWVYDLQADSWTQKEGHQTGATLWAYDPRSGLVVAGHDDAQKDLLGYDVETDT